MARCSVVVVVGGCKRNSSRSTNLASLGASKVPIMSWSGCQINNGNVYNPTLDAVAALSE